MKMIEAFENLRIADFSWVAAGPVHTKFFADFGATVIRIESMAHPDILRYTAPYKDNESGLNRSGYYAIYNTNKYSITLNMNDLRAREIAKRLVQWSDMVVENFVPGVMERWGLGYEDLRKIRPDIIMLRTCQMGQYGPYSKQPGFGPHLTALSGFTSISGWPDSDYPVHPPGAHGDYITPRLGIPLAIAALIQRGRTGKGICIDLSQLECSMHFQAPLVLDYSANGRLMTRKGNSSSYCAPCGIYRCKGEDRWCAVEMASDAEWESFCQLNPYLDWIHDPKFATMTSRKNNEHELNHLMEAWTIGFDAGEIMMLLQGSCIKAGIVKDSKDILSDVQLDHYGYYWFMEHPELGIFAYPGQAMHLSRTPAKAKLPSPCIGQHTEFVCREILGISDEDFISFLSDGVFGEQY